jgi:hypothetical protein
MNRNQVADARSSIAWRRYQEKMPLRGAEAATNKQRRMKSMKEEISPEKLHKIEALRQHGQTKREREAAGAAPEFLVEVDDEQRD